MNFRRPSLLLLLVVAAAGAACATSGSQSGAYGVAGGFEDCVDLYPAAARTYPVPSYGQAYAEDGPCSVYPRVDNTFPEYVVQSPVTRQVTAVEGRDRRTTRISRPSDPDSGSRYAGAPPDWSTGSSDSSFSSSGGGGTVSRMEPVLVSSPSGSSGPTTVTLPPREH